MESRKKLIQCLCQENVCDKSEITHLKNLDHLRSNVEEYLMKLTIENALKQGVAAHKEGKIQEAENLYRAILQSQPLHPDANHNLGVLALSVNKADIALPFFKTALEANPKIEQFWLSFIDVLIKIEEFDEARQTIADAKQTGIAADKLRIFEKKLEPELTSSNDISKQEISNRLDSHYGELSPAIKLREVGKYKEAQEWLNGFIQNNIANADALSLLSQVLMLDKKEDEAEKVLTAAASINPELASVYRNQARLLLKQSKTLEALKKAQMGCKRAPEDIESLLVLAACFRANQRDSEALPIIEKILKVEANHAEAYANRALIKHRAKDLEGAITDAKMAIKLKPHMSQMWHLLGSLYYQNSNLTDAIEAMRRAHKNEPENIAFMIQLAELLRQDDKASEAIKILEKATELAPKDATAWTNLGAVFQEENRISDAKVAYQKALALSPKSAALSVNLGTMAKEANDWETALSYFEKALEVEPNLAEARYNIGVTFQELGRLDEAETSYNQAIALKPDFAEAHNNLGITLKDLGRLDETEASYNQAIDLKPDFAEAHNNLANTLQDQGRFEEAEVSFRKAIELEPEKYVDAYDSLGFILQKKGEFEEAETFFKKWSAFDRNRIPRTKSMGDIFFNEGAFDKALAAFENYNDAKSKAQILESLLALGRVDEIYSRLEAEADLNDENIRVAAIAAFLSEREKKYTAHKFCNNPMDFLHYGKISSHKENNSHFIESVIEELHYVKTKWELNTTRNGFQASVDIFKNPVGNVSSLKAILLDEIDTFYSKFKDETCSFIKKWPSTNDIKGWHVVLKTQGHQLAHIHPTGWLSGVVYLKVVPALGKNEGAIEFSLNSKYYHHEISPSLTFQPEQGDIVLFPSSLYHRTIPFTTDTERIIVSFDLVPEAARR